MICRWKLIFGVPYLQSEVIDSISFFKSFSGFAFNFSFQEAGKCICKQIDTHINIHHTYLCFKQKFMGKRGESLEKDLLLL